MITRTHYWHVLTLWLISLSYLSHGAGFLAWPIDCQLNQACFIQNYMDLDSTSADRDYQCGSATYDGHTGTDIRLIDLESMNKNVEVRAAMNGVVFATRNGVKDTYLTPATHSRINKIGLGNAVVINHENGWQTVYGHMKNSSVRVKKGDRVVEGQVLGFVGLSGLTEFPHLHFGLKRNGKNIDPFTAQSEGKCGVLGSSHWKNAVPYSTSQILDMG